MNVNSHVGGTFLQPHHSHRAVAGLNVPTDTPPWETVADQSTQVSVLMVVVNAEASVIAIEAKIPLLVQVHERAQTDYG